MDVDYAEPPPSCVVYTPAPLARALVDALQPSPEQEWLEPCVGAGVFLSALSECGIDRSRITGVDLAVKPEAADRLARVRRGVDFLSWATTASRRFDCVVANPPYVALSSLPRSARRVATGVAVPEGLSVPGGSNLWYAFLCACLRLLKDGGRLGFVLPSALDYADYAARLREQLPRLFSRVDVLRCERPLFPTVLEGSVVLLASGFRRGPGVVRRRTFATLETLCDALRRLPAKVQRSLPKAPGRWFGPEQEIPAATSVQLRDVMQLRIGAVTGDAEFFLLTDDQRRALGLPAASCRPVLSRAQHLVGPRVDRAVWSRLRDSGERVWLFRPTSAVVRAQSAVRRYLRSGKCRKDRVKIRGRDVWYLTDLPVKPDAFLSGLSALGPWLCFSHTSSLSATNTLYTVRFVDRSMSDDLRAGWACALLTRLVRRQVDRRVRRYADGLRKLEPSDIMGLQLPTPSESIEWQPIYDDAVQALLDSGAEGAADTVDAYF